MTEPEQAEVRQHERRGGKGAPIRWKRLALALMAVIALGAAGVLWPRPSPQAQAPASLADEPSLGPADAPVTIVEYGDFGCTTCRTWYRQGVLGQILAHYGDRVRFIWRDFPIITAASPQAAEAGQCAFDQSRFWEYHDLLYDRAPALSVQDLKTYAADLGLNTTQFDTCLDTDAHQAKIEASTKDAYAHGFVATPAFLVNGQPIAGPQSFDVFKGVIDPILASAG
jgi:protein-disulfide isomerase